MPREPPGPSRHAALRARLCAVFALSSLAACGGKAHVPEPPDPSFVVHGDTTLIFGSGTRLKAHYLDAGGGARKRLAFQDTLMDTECNFVLTSLGQYHCLPVRMTEHYTDSACTVATLPVASACPDAPAPIAGDLISANADDCSALVAAYSLDKQQDLTTDFAAPIYATSPCTELPDEPARAVWTTKPEPLARFVAGTPSIVGSPDGMQAIRVTADDGAFDTLEPSVAGERCTRATVDGVNRCVPAPYGQRFLGLYADATCTDNNVAEARILFSQQCAAEQPRYLLDNTGDRCTSEFTAYALGEPLSPVYINEDSCVPLGAAVPIAHTLLYRVGARVAGSTFPVVHAAQVGAGTLTVSCFTDEAGTPLLTRDDVQSGVWELANGLSCSVYEDPNGQKRCINDALPLGTVSYFADASCSVPVYSADRSCGEPVVAYLIEQTFGSCSPKFNHLYFANPYSGPLYSTQSGNCEVLALASSDELFTAGQNIDPQIFPALADTTDP